MSPLQFVTVVCAVVAAAALGFLAAERLAKMLDGPHRGLALAGLILLNLIWAAIVAGLLFSTGDGGAPNFALLGAALLIAIIALVGGALYRIWLSVHEREKAKA